jgi:oligopeptide/dipeptide ABC transporter ATP-binding protein
MEPALMERALLRVSHLSKWFPVNRDLLGRSINRLSAVDDVSFELKQGEVLGIVGESGSGKSTLARLLLRLTRPTGGQVEFDGIDVLAARRSQSLELRRRIQIVFQDPYSSLDQRLRVDAILAEGFYHAGIGRREIRARSTDLVEQVGLQPSVLGSYPHQLSGGQRQRIGIARSLAANPELLIADEPVSALDASVQGQILNLLRRLQRERHLTMIFITHDLSVARHMSDRVAVMHLGKIVEMASARRIFDSPLHPYTQALLSAIPTYGEAAATRIVLKGDVPSPIDPPHSCRFASRCFRRLEVCTVDEPPLAPATSSDHLIACFNWRPLDDAESDLLASGSVH